jgi:uncharacterized membrane protein
MLKILCHKHFYRDSMMFVTFRGVVYICHLLVVAAIKKGTSSVEVIVSYLREFLVSVHVLTDVSSYCYWTLFMPVLYDLDT